MTRSPASCALWAAVLLAGAVLLLPTAIRAQGRINFQSSLTLSDGTTPPDGSYDLFFSLWDQPVDGTLSWWQYDPGIQVRDGVFSSMLGASRGSRPLEDALAEGGRYVEVVVIAGGGLANEVLGRVRLTSVPYAVRADRAEQADRLVDASSGAPDGSLPTGAIVLFAEGTSCPGGFEAMDGTSASAGVPFDMRGRFPVGADLAGTAAWAPDRIRERGGRAKHGHSGETTSEVGTTEGADPGSYAAALRNHHHVIPGHSASHLPPHLTVLFCRKL